MVIDKVYSCYTKINKNSPLYKNYESHVNNLKNDKYFHCRIFTIENVNLALKILDLADSNYIFTFDKNIGNKYSVLEAEVFIYYSNENFITLLNMIASIEYVDGYEAENKMSIIFNTINEYYIREHAV